jgi:AmmeMemoRadiSam system protein A
MKEFNKVILKLAHEAIREEVERKKLIKKDDYTEKFPQLLDDKAVFVTITKNGALRGCIGSIIPNRTLIDDIIHNAKAAAFEDPRFPSLKSEEFAQIDIEVSLLTVPKELDYTDKEDLKRKIKPSIDGVILSLNGYQATFLPQVWKELSGFEEFFLHLCMKAGLKANCLDDHPKIYTYQVESIS